MARLFDDASTEFLDSEPQTIPTGFPLTISAWAFMDDVTVDGTIFGYYDANQTKNWFRVHFRTSGDRFRADVFRLSGGINAAADSGETDLAQDTWHHVAGTATESGGTVTVNCFSNGGSKGTQSQTNDADPSLMDNVTIGFLGDSSPGGEFSGRIAEVAGWSTELSDGEIALLAKGFSPLFFQPQNLIFYAPLIRDEDFDKVGGISLVANNTPSVAEHPPNMIYPAPPFISYPAVAAAGNAMPMAIHQYRMRRVAA